MNVLGLELSRAQALLEKAGYAAETCEVASRKGVAGNERRVVREQALPVAPGGQPRVRLTCAVFCTAVQD